MVIKIVAISSLEVTLKDFRMGVNGLNLKDEVKDHFFNKIFPKWGKFPNAFLSIQPIF